MGEWLTGQQLVKRWGIKESELSIYLRKGLQPYNEDGQKIYEELIEDMDHPYRSKKLPQPIPGKEPCMFYDLSCLATREKKIVISEHVAACFKVKDVEEFEAKFNLSPAIKETAKGNIFKKEGQYWTLMFKGMKTPMRIKHQKGLLFIAYLLNHPGEEFNVIEFVQAVEGRPDNSYKAIEPGAIDEEDGSTYKLTGAQMIKTKKRLKQIKAELDRETDPMAQKELGKEYNQLIEKSESSIKTGIEKQQKTTSQCIHRALDAIKKVLGDNSPMYKHLKKYLTPFKNPISYNPDQNIFWQT